MVQETIDFVLRWDWETGDRRHEKKTQKIDDRRREIEDRRMETEDRRQKKEDMRRETEDRRQETVDPLPPMTKPFFFLYICQKLS